MLFYYYLIIIDRAPISTNENTDEEGHMTTSVCADNESDLEDFYPSDPMMSAALARAITDSEDEGGTPSISLTPRRSKQPSATNSDDGMILKFVITRQKFTI